MFVQLLLAASVAISAIPSASAGHYTVCYRKKEKVVDVGQVALFDAIIVDNRQHQVKPYDVPDTDVFVSVLPGKDLHRCERVTKANSKNQVHTVSCHGVEGQYLTFRTKGKHGVVICGLDYKARPLPPPAKDLNIHCTEVSQADIGFVLDASGSVTAKGYILEKDFVAAVIKSLTQIRADGKGIRIAAMSYAGNTFKFGPVLNRAQDENGYAAKVLALHYTRGGTPTAKALRTMSAHMYRYGRKGIPKIVVTLTDGVSSNQGATIREANNLRRKGAHLLSVGIGKNLRNSELNAMADKPTAKFRFNVNDFKMLDTIISKVKKSLFCKPG